MSRNSVLEAGLAPVWPNDCVFVYKLSGSGFESSCNQLITLVKKWSFLKNWLTLILVTIFTKRKKQIKKVFTS